MSIQDLQQNPQDTSNFYLAHIYHATINPNGSSSLPASPPPFTPPNYAVWVNALWFLSLVISITCALLATLLRQWARRYLKVTQPRYNPHKRARIRAFFAEGIDKFLLPWAVEALPTLLHVSLFLFFAGLAVFLWNVNLTIFKLVLSWVSLCTAIYGCITFFPVFHHDSPYHTPLSLPLWHFIQGIRFLTFRALELITSHLDGPSRSIVLFRSLAQGYGKWLVQGMQKTAEECALISPPEIDTRAFIWTLDCLDEDRELERFFSGLPGFRGSKMVEDPLPDLTPEQQEKLLDTLIGLSDRTSSSDLLPEQVKIPRTVICGKAIGPWDIPQAIERVLRRLCDHGLVHSTGVAHLVKGWDNGKDGETTMAIQAIVSSAIARAPRRDDLWFAMTADAMGLPKSVLRSHVTHGDSLSLAILIHIVRLQFSLFWKRHWPYSEFSKVLEAASNFDALDTSLDLQHEFCALWNQVIRKDEVGFPPYILKPIRNIYLALHLNTDSAPREFSASTGDEDDILQWVTAYPLCNVRSHHPDSAPRIHDVSASTSISRPFLHDNTALDPPFPPDAPSLSVTTPVHIDENPIDVTLLDDMSATGRLSCAYQTATASGRDSATSQDLSAAVATRDDSSAQTMPSTTRETPPPSFVPPTAAVSLRNNADLLVHSGALEIPSSASSEPVLDDITGPSLLPLTFFPGDSLRDTSYNLCSCFIMADLCAKAGYG